MTQTNDPNIGPGFTVVSAFPGKSQMHIALVIDVYKYPDLADMQIAMTKISEPALLIEKTSFTRTYSFTFGTILLTLLLVALISAFVYSIIWMTVNLRFGVYTFGASVWDRIFERLKLGRPLANHILKSEIESSTEAEPKQSPNKRSS